MGNWCSLSEVKCRPSPQALSLQTMLFYHPPQPILHGHHCGQHQAQESTEGSVAKTDLHVLFVSRKSLMFYKCLVLPGVFASLTCSSSMFMGSLDTDILSLELPTAYADLVSGHLTSFNLHYAATALPRMQAVAGVIPRPRPR